MRDSGAIARSRPAISEAPALQFLTEIGFIWEPPSVYGNRIRTKVRNITPYLLI